MRNILGAFVAARHNLGSCSFPLNQTQLNRKELLLVSLGMYKFLVPKKKPSERGEKRRFMKVG